MSHFHFKSGGGLRGLIGREASGGPCVWLQDANGTVVCFAVAKGTDVPRFQRRDDGVGGGMVFVGEACFLVVEADCDRVSRELGAVHPQAVAA